MNFKVQILASDKVVYEGECRSLVLPTTDGQYGIMADHCNMISAVMPGDLVYERQDGSKEELFVAEGLVKIENNEVLVLVSAAEKPDEIDENRARREMERAKEQLALKQGILEYRNAQIKLSRAINRLKIKNHS